MNQMQQALTAHKAYTTVRLTLLSAPETNGNGTDSCIQCQYRHPVYPIVCCIELSDDNNFL